MSRKRWLFALGLVCFALLTLKVGVSLYSSIRLRALCDTGFYMSLKGDQLVVEAVFPDTPATQLCIGDQITRIDGEEVTSGLKAIQKLYAMERRQLPGTPFTLTVRRGDETFDYALRTIEPPFVFSVFITRLALVLIPVVFLLTGLAVFLLKPFDKQASLLALTFGTLTGILGGGSMVLPDDLPTWLMRLMSFTGIASFTFFPLFFHFFLIFPETSPVLRRWPRLERYIYAPYLLIILPALVITFLLAEQSGRWQRMEFVVLCAIGVYCFACIIGGLVSLLVNYREARPLSRRKLRVVLAGSLFGFVPLLVIVGVQIASEAIGVRLFGISVWQWIAVAVSLCFLLFPASFAYAIVRHQVIPIRVIIRRGVRYLLVARGSKILETLAVGIALVFLLRVFFDYFQTADVFTITLASSIISIIVWNVTARLHHRLIAPMIDRRFFRRAYNAQNLLAELGDYLRTTTDLHDITARVSARVQDALQTENVTIFLYDEVRDEYLCVVTSQYVENDCVTIEEKKELTFAGDCSVVRRLREATQPLTVDFDEPGSWAARLSASENRDGKAQRESETLRCISSALLLPVTVKSGLLGFISLGERLGDLPFSREDRQMLMSVAYQMSFALQNRQLVERRAEEERLRRELEMATEVQQRLFPAGAPAISTAELCGVCHPALGVGGDYYDFISLDAGRIGIAIADVAGKGMSAALLMSTVQASLRSYAPIAASTDADITDLISSMNALLHASTAASSYATFFYAQYDEQRRTLTYVNAGHNPPLLVRAEGDGNDGRSIIGRNTVNAQSSSFAATAATLIAEEKDVIIADRASVWLTTGGPVIGIFDDCAYEQEQIALGAGDILVAYTDGVTEALNEAGEEFGGARLRERVIVHADLSAAEISAAVVAELETWTAGTTPHDDITLVVMKTK